MRENTEAWPRYDIGWMVTQVEKSITADGIKKIFKDTIREYEQEKEAAKRKEEKEQSEFRRKMSENLSSYKAYEAKCEEAYEKEYKRYMQRADIVLDDRNR